MTSPSRPSHRKSPPARSPDRHRHRSRHGHSHSHRHRHRDDSRSRSPHRPSRHRSDRHRHRHDRERDHREHKEHKASDAPARPVVLPLGAKELSRRDLEAYEPMFAMYLDIQKGLLIEDLQEEEVKGRWKSFVRKWNHGELAEGWYDPTTLQKARQSVEEEHYAFSQGRPPPDYTQGEGDESGYTQQLPAADDEDEDKYGPTLPLPNSFRVGAQSGPTIPNMQDLELKRESAIEDAIAAREESRQQYKGEMRSHKAAVRQLEDEIAPRAEPGTRERQLEKRREAAAANRSFAEARRGGSPEAAPEEELMGTGDNDLASLKREKEKNQRKKNEREIRREEILRARTAEREERVQKYREKEQETIGWLQTLAKQRFG
ncbi:uncharacterized protein N7459_004325 [Penicillium hispanicum]|uniref:uncharacterized protein n=1 Tax=Penicillium hispanicum TaxID=1080232 RepID=UPI002541E77B|nr:uncharacterized protein N7459_004325 [Penicillium hispanicum]KAJ5584525.1 hypothetical protein N7459_004325 [Penicillium hispanicum]